MVSRKSDAIPLVQLGREGGWPLPVGTSTPGVEDEFYCTEQYFSKTGSKRLMGIVIKDWFGLLELYFVVEKWRPVYKGWNEWWGLVNARHGFAIFITDREAAKQFGVL